jgi:hypothetical protein
VLFTANHPQSDCVLRALPNITAGYNIFKNTSVYTNYFALKDLYYTHPLLNAPTTQSLAWGIRHNKSLGEKTDLQFDMQARELWQISSLHQFDFLPGVTLTRRLKRGDIAFASALLQLRGAQYFGAPTREVDPFYTVGYIRRRGMWTFSCSDTLATNYRNPLEAIPRQSNVSMISDIEVNRPVSKRFPSLLAFTRAEPIWNAGAHNAAGLSDCLRGCALPSASHLIMPPWKRCAARFWPKIKQQKALPYRSSLATRAILLADRVTSPLLQAILIRNLAQLKNPISRYQQSQPL